MRRTRIHCRSFGDRLGGCALRQNFGHAGLVNEFIALSGTASRRERVFVANFDRFGKRNRRRHKVGRSGLVFAPDPSGVSHRRCGGIAIGQLLACIGRRKRRLGNRPRDLLGLTRAIVPLVARVRGHGCRVFTRERFFGLARNSVRIAFFDALLGLARIHKPFFARGNGHLGGLFNGQRAGMHPQAQKVRNLVIAGIGEIPWPRNAICAGGKVFDLGNPIGQAYRRSAQVALHKLFRFPGDEGHIGVLVAKPGYRRQACAFAFFDGFGDLGNYELLGDGPLLALLANRAFFVPSVTGLQCRGHGIIAGVFRLPLPRERFNAFEPVGGIVAIFAVIYHGKNRKAIGNAHAVVNVFRLGGAVGPNVFIGVFQRANREIHLAGIDRAIANVHRRCCIYRSHASAAGIRQADFFGNVHDDFLGLQRGHDRSIGGLLGRIVIDRQLQSDVAARLEVHAQRNGVQCATFEIIRLAAARLGIAENGRQFMDARFLFFIIALPGAGVRGNMGWGDALHLHIAKRCA